MTYCRFDYITRGFFATVPATVTINNRPVAGKGPAFRLSPAWEEFYRAINTPEAIRFIFSPQSGLVNEGYREDRLPMVQSLTMGGNVAVVEKLNGKFARISTFKNDQLPPDPAEYTFQKHPEAIHRFTAVARRGEPRNPGRGIIAYFPLLVRDGDAWVEISKIELFDALPKPIMPGEPDIPKLGYWVTTLRATWLRTGPFGNQARRAAAGEPFFIVREARGWGETSFRGSQRWVDLSQTRHA